MRLHSIYIERYKSLENFHLQFGKSHFMDVFVGKNGTGKSNLFEALLEIFRHLYEFDKAAKAPYFDYRLSYEVNNKSFEFNWADNVMTINGERRTRIDKKKLPDNILVYYSGHNRTVSELISRYENTYRRKIRRTSSYESRQFIGIGPDYKELLLTLFLTQKSSSHAKQFICKKLSIAEVGKEIKLVLGRPLYARGDSRFDIVDRTKDRYWKLQGSTAAFLDELAECESSYEGVSVRDEGYIQNLDKHTMYLDIEKFRKMRMKLSDQQVFQRFDNLKILGMLEGMSVSLTLSNGSVSSTAYFSDGQFQVVHIFALNELFKDSHCIVLLDEPDSFLHPEWQFEFLKQVLDITDSVDHSNHVLMSTHSASTVSVAKDEMIYHFAFENGGVAASKVDKANVIKSLSAGLISFSEGEARLNIRHFLKSTKQPVLFTEGITDELILETAWDKLYPESKRRFEIQQAFGRGFLRSLMQKVELYDSCPGRTFFALFDFDEAYGDWDRIGKNIVQGDLNLGLVRKREDANCYAMLLPVPKVEQIRNQVINPKTDEHFKNDSKLTVELLFYGIKGLDNYVEIDTSQHGDPIRFSGEKSKVSFARKVVPELCPENFEIFRPILDFVSRKCPR